MSLHNEIMNLPIFPNKAITISNDPVRAYEQGHRDARHGAAELSLKYEPEEVSNPIKGEVWYYRVKGMPEGELRFGHIVHVSSKVVSFHPSGDKYMRSYVEFVELAE